jgi:hypothetical protein
MILHRRRQSGAIDLAFAVGRWDPLALSRYSLSLPGAVAEEAFIRGREATPTASETAELCVVSGYSVASGPACQATTVHSCVSGAAVARGAKIHEGEYK